MTKLTAGRFRKERVLITDLRDLLWPEPSDGECVFVMGAHEVAAAFDKASLRIEADGAIVRVVV
jgi:hypothetical protein